MLRVFVRILITANALQSTAPLIIPRNVKIMIVLGLMKRMQVLAAFMGHVLNRTRARVLHRTTASYAIIGIAIRFRKMREEFVPPMECALGRIYALAALDITILGARSIIAMESFQLEPFAVEMGFAMLLIVARALEATIQRNVKIGIVSRFINQLLVLAMIMGYAKLPILAFARLRTTALLAIIFIAIRYQRTLFWCVRNMGCVRILTRVSALLRSIRTRGVKIGTVTASFERMQPFARIKEDPATRMIPVHVLGAITHPNVKILIVLVC